MPRRRDPDAPRVVYRTARCGLRVTRHRKDRVFGLLRSAGDVWCAVLELNAWRRRRQGRPLVSCQELCGELAAAGPGTPGELDSTGARSVLRRYSDEWFAAAKRRAEGGETARFPRRKRGLVPVRWYHGTFTLEGRVLRIPVARGRAGHVLDVPVVFPAGAETRREGVLVPALRAGRAPRPGRGRQHRRQETWRRDHPRHPARDGDHAPSYRNTPPRSAPGAA